MNVINEVKLPVVLCLEPDLFFSTRLIDVIRAQGGKARVVETPEEFVDAVDAASPVLALVDLATPGDWAGAITRCKLRPHSRQMPIYAFGSHVAAETLRTARQAGADHAWARSKMMEELVDLVGRHIHPPIMYPIGWDEPLPEQARIGIEEFNRRQFFEQHESLEAAWKAEPRPIRELYQGILPVGVAFLQIERGNWAGAIKMLRRGLPRLRTLPAVCQGVDVATLHSAAEAIMGELTVLGPEHLAEFDQSQFPRIQLQEGTAT